MAARFWVGGAGTWDATSTVHWSDTSGGAAGFSAPTSADTATFNSASNATAYAVTIGTNAVCLDVSIAGPGSGSVTITSGATAVINVYGSWLNTATGVVFSSTAGCILNFLATTTGKTVTTNSVTLGPITVNFNGVGGYWTLGTGIIITAGASPTILAGTFDTGGFAMTLNSFTSTVTTNVRAINLNNSVIICSGTTALSLAATNLTFNAGTSTITASGANSIFNGGGHTFYNVSFTSTAFGTSTINGANTFNNLTQATPAASQKIVTLGADQVINGTLTLGATNTAPLRVTVGSDVVGTQRTLTVATLATLADVDFRDVVAAGTSIALGNWSGTRIGNCLGNSNITFDAPKTVYWNLPAGGIWNSNAWALTSGGAVAVNNFPLAQDTVIIGNAGLNVGAAINISTNADIGTLDMSTRTTAVIFQQGNTDPKFYGNVTLCSSLTIGNTVGTPTYQFQGQGLANTFNTAGVTLALSQFNVNCPTGSLTLLSNATIELTASTSGTAILTAGTFNLNGFNLTAVAFSNSNATTRTFTQGTGTVNITGSNGAIWNSSNTTGLTYTTRPVVNFTYAGSTGSRTITTNAASIIDANITAGTDNVILATAVGNLNFTGFAGSFADNTRAIYGDLTLASGMTVTSGALGTTFDRTGTQTITSGTQTFTNLILYSEQFDNVNWVKTNTTVTANVIVAPDSTTTADLVLDTATAGVEHYITAQILTLTNQPYTQSVYVKASAAPSFLFMVVSVGASSTTSAITFTQTAGVYAPATTANGLITSAAATSVGNGWYRCSVIYTLNGTVTAHQMRLYPYLGGLYTGTGIGTYFWGAQAEIGATLTTYIPTTATTASTTGNRIIDFPIAFSNSGTTNCLDALTLGSTRGLTLTGGTLNLKSGVTSTVGSFVTTGTTMKYLGSTVPGTQATISDASGTDTVTYLTIQDSNATGGATWNALATTNADNGNNTGWSFTPGILVTGVVAYGFIGPVNVWGLVDDTQIPGWVIIPDGQTPGWGAVSNPQTPNWQSITA